MWVQPGEKKTVNWTERSLYVATVWNGFMSLCYREINRRLLSFLLLILPPLFISRLPVGIVLGFFFFKNASQPIIQWQLRTIAPLTRHQCVGVLNARAPVRAHGLQNWFLINRSASGAVQGDFKTCCISFSVVSQHIRQSSRGCRRSFSCYDKRKYVSNRGFMIQFQPARKTFWRTGCVRYVR